MRVWLVDDPRSDSAGSLGEVLRQLQQQPEYGLELLGVSGFRGDLTAAISKLLPDLLDVLVVHDSAWPPNADLQGILSLGAGLVLALPADRCERYRSLADQFPVCFLRESPAAEELWLALVGSSAARRRHNQLRNQITRLQQRLDDRIIIERAKGILVQRLRISEEEAYQRLRLQSRRQRRQMREIAQSLLDTQSLMDPFPSGNGLICADEEDETRQHVPPAHHSSS